MSKPITQRPVRFSSSPEPESRVNTFKLYLPRTKIISYGISGNLHSVAAHVTKYNLADFYLHASTTGFNSVALFRVPLDFDMDKHFDDWDAAAKARKRK